MPCCDNSLARHSYVSIPSHANHSCHAKSVDGGLFSITYGIILYVTHEKTLVMISVFLGGFISSATIDKKLLTECTRVQYSCLLHIGDTTKNMFSI